MMKQTIIAATVSFFLFGCGAGDEPYKEVPKAVEQQAWQQFNTDELWLYVPSTADAPRYAVNMDPFFQGEEKIVKLQFVEEGLRVVEVDRDTTAPGQPPRWNDVAPVLTIPGDYLDYRCAEDAYGECTRKEEVNSDANVLWDQKRYFHPKFKDLKGHEVNTIDLWYKNDNVRETATPRVVRWEMDAAKGVINVELERTFTVNRSAMSDYLNTGFNDLSFKTSFTIHWSSSTRLHPKIISRFVMLRQMTVYLDFLIQLSKSSMNRGLRQMVVNAPILTVLILAKAQLITT
ncbi:hypothetical protein ACSZNO_02410 [Aeromonas veronii]